MNFHRKNHVRKNLRWLIFAQVQEIKSFIQSDNAHSRNYLDKTLYFLNLAKLFSDRHQHPCQCATAALLTFVNYDLNIRTYHSGATSHLCQPGIALRTVDHLTQRNLPHKDDWFIFIRHEAKIKLTQVRYIVYIVPHIFHICIM